MGPFEADGRYFCSNGAVRTDNSDNNVIEAYGTDGLEDCIVRRAFRGDKFVFHFKFKWNNDSAPGCLVRWVSPGDYLALAIDPADDKTRLYKRQSDGTLTTLSTANGSQAQHKSAIRSPQSPVLLSTPRSLPRSRLASLCYLVTLSPCYPPISRSNHHSPTPI